MDRPGHAPAPAPPVQVQWAGRWHRVHPGRPFVIGRAPESQLQIDHPDVSRQHLAVVPVGSGWELRDTSRNGTYVGGRRVASLPVTGELVVSLGTGQSAPVVVIRAADGPPAPPSSPPRPPSAARPSATKVMGQGKLTALHQLETSRLRIGRAPDNDVVLDDLLVSRYHAELRRGPAGWQLVDVGRRNGTYVNGRQVTEAAIGPDDVIGIGHALLQLEGDRLVEYVDVGEIGFRAEGLTVRTSSGKVLLDDVGFVLEERSLLAVVGPSGAGKSTLLHLLLGFVHPDSGRVLVNGVDLAELDLRSWRRQLAWVPQRPHLFVGSVEENIRLGSGGDVLAAARAAVADEFLDRQPEELSAGQRQRVALARAFLRDAPIVLLDEPTARLDLHSEALIVDAARRLLTGRTAVLVAHRPAMLAAADRVIRLRDGRVEAPLEVAA